MIKYAKIANEQTKEVNVGVGTNAEFYKSLGMTPMDVEQSYTGAWYLTGYAPVKPHNQEIQEQIDALEEQVTDRNVRGALLGDEFAINKITQIEAKIEELRQQMEAQQ